MAGKAHPVSPLAPEGMPELPPVAGVELGAVEAGVRYKGRVDLMMMRFQPGTVAAGVFTNSKCASAPVDWCRAMLEKSPNARALVVNAGNANAFTGKAGAAAAKTVAVAAAKLVGCKADAVFMASTGVIGEVLPAEKVTAALPRLATTLKPERWDEAARAIMTTDTFPKAAVRRTDIDGKPVTIVGIAKGSGMIAPDMATMLSFVATDATIPADVLQALLSRAADRSFNSITVDGDTSTSDTLMAFATGKGVTHKPVVKLTDGHFRNFRTAFEDLLVELAQLVVKDGEGASKFVTITVTGSQNARTARKIALTIANSPLVKTAIAGGDANWGRIVMAVGKAGEKADRDKIAIRMGGRLVAEKGAVHPQHDEAAATEHFKGTDILIEVDVGVGKGTATVWTCDLTHGYIDINADYRS
ncbi:bifunctional glutamate N-acetyltransferase/amino-acid acetyltransferase ArgJ [Zavarzinia compransoris]|uniref:bifunctional glutamate N-acetyltransferase/amino-acid acetyltransferase ArgJ n=1 Tax=Zavarzinia marina TaxID=2911065 RepID=UPI001F2C4864|nr:bifunctional glutamate N-acetyltransferase/amino-acid acetyltransferase ArgJ [Zavarzinia marina]MCF4167051.1 bifunctional glutamate N-acetyltransferase/amino-acid acetyltransferase ArgJ [Zavarzinia marina]